MKSQSRGLSADTDSARSTSRHLEKYFRLTPSVTKAPQEAMRKSHGKLQWVSRGHTEPLRGPEEQSQPPKFWSVLVTVS